MHCLRLAPAALATAALALGPLTPCRAEALPARTNSVPTVTAPKRINVFPTENVSFTLDVADADGPIENVRVTIENPNDVPRGSFLSRDHDGAWVMFILADPKLQPQNPGQQANVFSIRFIADDGSGGHTSASTDVHFLRERGQNLPSIVAPVHLKAPAAVKSDFAISATDPDDDPGLTLEAVVAEPAHGITVQIDRATGGAFRLSVTPPAAAEGHSVQVNFAATDSTGKQAFGYAFLEVPLAGSIEIVSYEIRWAEPHEGEQGQANFNPPEDIEAFPVAGAFARLNDPTPQADLEAYAVYASPTPDFEPSGLTLVALADPTWLNGTVTLTLDRAKNHVPMHIRCTVRRKNGESKPSKETSSDTPRFPGRPTYKKGKLTIAKPGSNLDAGSFVEVRSAALPYGERFPIVLHKKGAKWLVKASTQSASGAYRFKDVVRPGQAVVLLLVSDNGKLSLPYPFVP